MTSFAGFHNFDLVVKEVDYSDNNFSVKKYCDHVKKEATCITSKFDQGGCQCHTIWDASCVNNKGCKNG